MGWKPKAEDGSWDGSLYELSMQFAPDVAHETRASALAAIWSQSQLTGPWCRQSDVGDPGSISLLTEWGAAQFGLLTLPSGVELGCLLYVIFEAGEHLDLDLSIPCGLLQMQFDVSYPLDLATNPWLVELDRTLAELGSQVFRRVPFSLGVLGHEAGADGPAEKLTLAEIERGGLLVPRPLWEELGPARTAEWLQGDLAYVPFVGPQIELSP